MLGLQWRTPEINDFVLDHKKVVAGNHWDQYSQAGPVGES